MCKLHKAYTHTLSYIRSFIFRPFYADIARRRKIVYNFSFVIILHLFAHFSLFCAHFRIPFICILIEPEDSRKLSAGTFTMRLLYARLSLNRPIRMICYVMFSF